MEGFSRTLSGKIAKFLFYSEPIVWVEGPTDIPFYDIILGDIPCRIEVAGGKIESRKLADALVEDELPYVVIMDGDYMILERQRSWHRRIILLHRHSSENYLFENEALLAIFRRYAGANDNFDSVSRQWTKLLEQIEDELREMLILDIAHVREATPNAAIPSSPEALFETLSWPIQFSPSRVHHYCSECKAQINEAQIALAESLLESYLEGRRFVDILPGHFVFGTARYFLIGAIQRERGKKPNIDNQGLRLLLCAEVWNSKLTADHRSLQRRLRRAVREAYRMSQSPA